MSPEIAEALAISGKLNLSPLVDTIKNSNGEEIKFKSPACEGFPSKGQAKTFD